MTKSGRVVILELSGLRAATDTWIRAGESGHRVLGGHFIHIPCRRLPRLYLMRGDSFALTNRVETVRIV